MKPPTGKKRNKFTIEFGRANLYAFLLNIPITIILFSSFYFIWKYDVISSVIETSMDYFILILIGGVIVHELLHGFTWAIFASRGLNSIKFGFKLKYITPYCHCQEALKVKQYRTGIFMPLAILGIIPSIYAIIAGNAIVFFYGVLFTCLASGDIIVLLLLSKLDNECYIIDHPKKMGFYLKNGKE